MALAVCDILWGSIPIIMCFARFSRIRGWEEQRPACRLSDPPERDLTSVAPDHHRSMVGRQTPGEPTRRWQALHEPTRPTTYRTLRTTARTIRQVPYKSALQPLPTPRSSHGVFRIRAPSTENRRPPQGCGPFPEVNRWPIGTGRAPSKGRRRTEGKWDEVKGVKATYSSAAFLTNPDGLLGQSDPDDLARCRT